MNLQGYGLAFAAVCYYNFKKLQDMQAARTGPATPNASAAAPA
jgi:hypothetical protein